MQLSVFCLANSGCISCTMEKIYFHIIRNEERKPKTGVSTISRKVMKVFSRSWDAIACFLQNLAPSFLLIKCPFRT